MEWLFRVFQLPNMEWLFQVFQLPNNADELITFSGIAASLVSLIGSRKNDIPPARRIYILFIAVIMWIGTLLFIVSYATDLQSQLNQYLNRAGYVFTLIASFFFLSFMLDSIFDTNTLD